MPWEIAETLAAYLEVPLCQVTAWDSNVINRLFNDHSTFRAFQLGGQQAKWDIYHAIKYAGIA